MTRGGGKAGIPSPESPLPPPTRVGMGSTACHLNARAPHSDMVPGRSSLGVFLVGPRTSGELLTFYRSLNSPLCHPHTHPKSCPSSGSTGPREEFGSRDPTIPKDGVQVPLESYPVKVTVLLPDSGKRAFMRRQCTVMGKNEKLV